MLLAFAWVGLAATTAMAQRSAVTVDLGVLDTLGPADPTANPGSRIRLHRPTPPAQAPAAAPVSGKTAPIQAGSQPQAAGKAPPSAAAPAQQATLAPPTLVAPPAPSPTPPAPAPAPTVAAEHIVFQPDDTNLADEAKQELDRLAARLGADARLYVQLVAYASSGSGGDASQARRLSLSRALAARSYLVDHGVEIKQIDVRPLGNKSEPGAVPDRIDLLVTQR
jgi:outer membrane protein OmpA-like peptidoglycan-associated protein